MKRTPQHLVLDLPPVRAFPQDLRQICSLIASLASEEVQIRVGPYLLDDVAEMTELAERQVTDVIIQAHHPGIWIALCKSYARLEFDDDSPEARGVFEMTADVLRKRAPLPKWVVESSLILSSVLLALVFCLGIALLLVGKYGPALWAFVGLLGVAAPFRYAYRLRNECYAVVFTTDRTEQPSFLVRHKDDIVLAIISAVTGAIVTLLISKLL